jgi:hypothetical protein
MLNIKECILLIKIIFLPEDLALNSIENFCNFLSFFISNNEFIFEFDKIFIFSSDLINNNNINFFKFYLIRKLCGLSSINKISSILNSGNLNLINNNNSNNNDLELIKFIPKENKPNWK